MTGAKPDNFDPYRKWLGIPQKDQPPHHYRLLGIAPFEDDPDVIDNAADRQMAHVRTFQGGKHVSSSQRILNELASAKVCLLDARTKAQYDEQLREQLEPEANQPTGPHGHAAPAAPPPSFRQVAPPQAPPAPPATPAEETSAQVETGEVATVASSAGGPVPTNSEAMLPSPVSITSASRGRTRVRTRKKSSPMPTLVFGTVGAVLLATLVGLAVGLSGSNEGDKNKSRTRNNGSTALATKRTESGQAGSNRHRDETKRSKPDREDAAIKWPRTGQSNRGEDPDPTPLRMKTPAEPVKESPGDAGVSPLPETEADPIPRIPGLDAPDRPIDQPPTDGDSITTAPRRKPIPADKEQRAARAAITKTYRDAFLQARTAPQKQELAKSIVTQALGEQDDAIRFVLLEKAREMAVELAKPDAVVLIVDEMADRYDLDPLGEKAIYLSRCVAHADTRSKNGAIFDHAKTLYQTALSEKKYEVAASMARVASRAAGKANMQAAVRSVEEAMRRIERLVQTKRKAESAVEVLKENPDDPAANSAVGRYLCFVEGDWRRGLPMLAKGVDEGVRELAERDIACPENPEDQIELADAWLAMGRRKGSSVAGKGMVRRALVRYEQVLPQLSGLKKVKAEDRIREIKSELPDDEAGPATAPLL